MRVALAPAAVFLANYSLTSYQVCLVYCALFLLTESSRPITVIKILWRFVALLLHDVRTDVQYLAGRGGTVTLSLII